MPETLLPSPESSESDTMSIESRFGDRQSIERAMEAGSARVLGRLEDFYDIPPHQNVVELARVTHQSDYRANLSELVVIDAEGMHLQGVFKPESGEDRRFHEENGLGHDDSREVAAYLVSKHFGFDLVPPTVLRTIGNEVGSLQLFLPPTLYEHGEKVMSEPENLDKLQHSKDVLTLNVFDWIIANADRHTENYLVKAPTAGIIEPTIAAIDNGASFNQAFYTRSAKFDDISGPYQFLTRDVQSGQGLRTPLPDTLLNAVERGLQDRDKLTEALSTLPNLEKDEIDSMWQRVLDLIRSRCFLSGYNYSDVMEGPR